MLCHSRESLVASSVMSKALEMLSTHTYGAHNNDQHQGRCENPRSNKTSVHVIRLTEVLSTPLLQPSHFQLEKCLMLGVNAAGCGASVV